MTWNIKLEAGALKALKKLDAYEGLWRYRVGDYRLICQIKDQELVILVVEIGHRREVYR